MTARAATPPDTDDPRADGRPRCTWPQQPIDVRYHDAEWGVPHRGDALLFELLTLEGAQAGLSWTTVLKKRDRYREVFAGFDPARVARFGARDVERLLGDAGIVRHRGKIESTIANARAVLAVQERHGSFTDWLWEVVEGHPIVHARRTLQDVPAKTPHSDALSKRLKGAGFTFVGSTICYAFMQASGMVNDHLVTCFRHDELAR